MKHKKLAIIFFSLMAVAATPRAMHHFHNYLAAAQEQAQVKFLRFLLSHSATGENSVQATGQKPQILVACTEPFRNVTRTEITKTSAIRKSRSNAKQGEIIERPALNRELSAADFLRFDEIALDEIRSELESTREALIKQPSREQIAQAQYLAAMVRFAGSGDQKSAQALEKELASFIKRNSNAPARVLRMKLKKEHEKAIVVERESECPEAADCGPIPADSWR